MQFEYSICSAGHHFFGTLIFDTPQNILQATDHTLFLAAAQAVTQEIHWDPFNITLSLNPLL